MSLSLIVPIAADRPEYEHTMPYVFNFSEDGALLCIKSIQGLDLTKFEHIYFVILDKLNQKFHLSELLNMQLRNLGLSEKAKVLSLKVPTNSQAETIYECVKQEQIEGGIFVKDADGYFTCDFTETNGIAIYPLDKLDMVNPHNKSYVDLDDQFYITNIIEKKIISRYFNAGGYLFEDARQFCSYYERLSHFEKLYMSHIVYAMLLDNKSFRPFEVEDYQDWGNKEMYSLFLIKQRKSIL